jgi:hypothetical protein
MGAAIPITLARSHVLSSGTPLVIDDGFGARAWTMLEMLDRWRPINPSLRIIGVEFDPERLLAAKLLEKSGTVEFYHGGFNLVDVLGAKRAHTIRAYNRR